jgi:hypothetical protein
MCDGGNVDGRKSIIAARKVAHNSCPLWLGQEISTSSFPKASMQFPIFFPDLEVQLTFQNRLLSTKVNRINDNVFRFFR